MVNATSHVALSQFCGKQLSRLGKLVSGAADAQAAWDKAILPSLQPSTGKLKTIAPKQLFTLVGIGGSAWLDQFAVCFPITGTISQKGVYPVDPSAGPPPKSFSSIFETSSIRFRERAAKSGCKNAAELRGEALGHVKSGWLEEPIKLTTDGRPEGFECDRSNVAFRFGVSQDYKLRACGDLRHSLTNEACAVLTPIQLVSWGNSAHLFKTMCGADRSWRLFKADRQAAYKQLPLRPADQLAAVIALRRPISGCWYSF